MRFFRNRTNRYNFDGLGNRAHALKRGKNRRDRRRRTRRGPPNDERWDEKRSRPYTAKKTCCVVSLPNTDKYGPVRERNPKRGPNNDTKHASENLSHQVKDVEPRRLEKHMDQSGAPAATQKNTRTHTACTPTACMHAPPAPLTPTSTRTSESHRSVHTCRSFYTRRSTSTPQPPPILPEQGGGTQISHRFCHDAMARHMRCTLTTRGP